MIDFITSNELRHLLVTYGYLAIFLVVAIESTGIPVPGETMLIIASVYAGTTHHLQIEIVIVAAIAGAILGDNFGFVAGQYGGYRLLRRFGKYIFLDERKLLMGNYLFEHYGGTVVFFGRFLPILRIWAAFLAGTHRMRWQRFLAFNAAGGAVWATSVGAAGYIFGNSLLRAGGLLSVVSAVLALVMVAVVSLVVHRGERRLREQVERDQQNTGAA